ncbi:vanadium-dependent haloperoxidase [Tenggerimyces flavus]|uniref:Vanadium-dependent haloperoxidase n=1 Tax=Tenggerimyces flavus TaxID=1708749 RepID=A0ABV7YC88_9ACTN|nr:vanadium-dependent haloperoxidase [Tenggerimyces flavus]MBM7783694.1 hypothetical protein [Tenggerimyces flavus]
MRSTILAASAAAVLSVGLVAPVASAERPADPAVVTTWNQVAADTIAKAGVPVQASALYFGFVSLATYDAVVTIEGGYEPYLRQPRAHRKASSQIAAATAAYKTLRHYFPASAADLDLAYDSSLATVPNGVGKTEGVKVGERAAQALIDERAHDGRDAPITLNVTPKPGVWRPTPPALAPMSTPWLGFVDPLTLRSPKQIKVRGVYSIKSRAYAKDVEEVRAWGEKDESVRSAHQTETALFWSVSPVQQYQAALRDRLKRHPFDIARSARAFAMLSSANADALIACWRTKYDDPFWRPVTAIREAVDPAKRDLDWEPLIATPPYPEYASGHACVSGSASEVFARLFGKRSLDLNISSTGPGTTITRHYDSARALDKETMNARVWLGIHFRWAMDDGNKLGHQIASWAMKREFQRD